MTARDLIKSSLRLIGAIAPGEDPTDAEAQDALMVANQMIDSWTAERLLIFTIARQIFNLVAGQQAYTMGTGGDFNVSRPPKIDHMGIILLSNPAQPLELPIQYLTDEQWAAIPVKAIASTVPLQVWDDGGFPLRTLNFWPYPSELCQTAIYTWTQLTQFATLDTDNTYPPGYLKALRYSLAVDLMPEFPGNPQTFPLVAAQAIQAKAMIKSMNVEPADLLCDGALVNPKGGAYNWKSDTFGRPY